MNRTTLDLWVGFFVAIGLASLLFLALKVGGVSVSGSGETYALEARFGNIGGLKVRAPIKSAGVVVGRVSDIKFDPENYLALVTLDVDARYKFPRDTFATINTSGLLGEQYIGFEAGGDEEVLKAGESIKKTQDAMVLEKLISQFMYNGV
jgi:phospholipid/cholesterol/gamma-HCH transport system substrate-binding protein